MKRNSTNLKPCLILVNYTSCFIIFGLLCFYHLIALSTWKKNLSQYVERSVQLRQKKDCAGVYGKQNLRVKEIIFPH